MRFYLLILLLSIGSTFKLHSQRQSDFAGIEISVDQDYFADWIRENVEDEDQEPYFDKNYTVALRLGFYGEYANSYYLGLPWVRERIDYLIDNILYRSDFRQKTESHSFLFLANGFSPTHISDEVDGFEEAVANGYSLATDRPFSSFTGFRSSRRLEGTKRFVHSARLFDMGVNTSFSFGIGGTGLAKGIDNLFGFKRPDGNLWKRDENKPYPTGEVIKNILPLVQYSVSSEIAIWTPIRKIVFQVRPELNLGHYTDIAFGIDFGKVMSVEGVIDHLAYTDVNNPSNASVNDEDFGFSLVGGVTGRAVLYNYHLNGVYGKSKGNFYTFGNTRKFIWEAYVGVKLQILQKVDLIYTINTRSPEFKSAFQQRNTWGTLTLKVLLGPAGVGCYD